MIMVYLKLHPSRSSPSCNILNVLSVYISPKSHKKFVLHAYNHLHLINIRLSSIETFHLLVFNVKCYVLSFSRLLFRVCATFSIFFPRSCRCNSSFNCYHCVFSLLCMHYAYTFGCLFCLALMVEDFHDLLKISIAVFSFYHFERGVTVRV